MNIDLKIAFFEQLERCGVFNLIDDFFNSDDFEKLSKDEPLFYMDIGPKGLRIISQGGAKEYARQSFSSHGIPDMPLNLLREFMGSVIEYCQQYHKEYEYLYTRRKLSKEESDTHSYQATQGNRKSYPFDIPKEGSNSVFQKNCGDNPLSRYPNVESNYRIYNRPGGDYMGPRSDGMTAAHRPVQQRSPEYTVSEHNPNEFFGFIISVTKK